MREKKASAHLEEPRHPEGSADFDALAELALDLRWTWDHASDLIWRRLDPELWELTQNPWIVMQTISLEKVAEAFSDPTFRRLVEDRLQTKREALTQPSWFARTYPEAGLKGVACFSMEFMLSEALPIYSGGLGNVVGDLLKGASDLGLPLIGVGLLYQQGYFRQIIDHEGLQQAIFPYNDPGQLPIMPLRRRDGEWLRLEIELPGYAVWLRAWQVQLGRIKLYLLDSNDPANYPAHRGITSELYGGGPELRLKQEMLLGLGGWRLLAELGLEPEVCHLNEGHVALAVLERARSYMAASGQLFEVALAVTRAGNVFTKHTAVDAGLHRFAPALIERHLGGYARQQLGIELDELLALGRQNPGDSAEPFSMAYLAIRGSGAVNGVSRLHGQVSRRLFQPLFPRWPTQEVPVGHVTNGVHMPTWDSAHADQLWTEACGKHRWRGTWDTLAPDMRCLPNDSLWRFRTASRASLVEYARLRLSRQLAASGEARKEYERALQLFDANTLMLGFARRFTDYKRPNLLLHDPERLLRLLNHPQRPVNIIMAGKAHPDDRVGQAMIQQWIHFIRRPEARAHVIFLSDYDMHLTEHLVQGVDVWLNTPRRPWEACGTSGMKILVNGGINLSELDGWWAEAYAPDVGWALGDGQEHAGDPAWDAVEAEALYTLLEQEVIPEFYTRDEQGIPHAWVARMRESMARLTPQFSTNRSLREYTEHYYLPAAAAYRQRAAGRGEAGAAIVHWQRDLERKWPALHFGELKVESTADWHEFEVQLYLDELAPEAVTVELYANGLDGQSAERVEMQRVRPLVGATNGYAYHERVPARRPAADYTPRLIPHHPGVQVPLEVARVLWQR